jgi:hypothetical protein
MLGAQMLHQLEPQNKLQVGHIFGEGKLFHDPPLVLEIRVLRWG